MVVNVGSGISILKVTGPESFQRVSGTALGGGTFWGLVRLLTKITSFEEVLRCCMPGGAGDNKNVDLLVSDLYGTEKYKLTENVIASSYDQQIFF